jgi:hypothetical protein
MSIIRGRKFCLLQGSTKNHHEQNGTKE